MEARFVTQETDMRAEGKAARRVLESRKRC